MIFLFFNYIMELLLQGDLCIEGDRMVPCHGVLTGRCNMAGRISKHLFVPYPSFQTGLGLQPGQLVQPLSALNRLTGFQERRPV